MKIPALVAISLACASAVAASAARAPGAFDEALDQLSRATSGTPLARRADAQPPELRVLLGSVDVTLHMIDAYGQCRDEPRTHEECMALIRETLEHARGMLGR